MTNKGTIKVIDKGAVVIITAGLIGSIITFMLLAITAIIAMAEQDSFSSTFLFTLTLFHFGMSVMLISILWQHLTDEKYFNEIEIIMN